MYKIIFSTAGSKEEAEKIAKALIEKKLAACIQVVPCTSFYTWKLKFVEDAEFLMIIKYPAHNYDKIEELIKKKHSYETPEILEIGIENASHEYLDWIDAVTE